MSNYYLHFERFSDNSLLHIGACDEKEQVKIFDVNNYNNNLLALSEELLLYVSKNRTENANLYLHNYKDDLRLINKFIRRIEQFIIKADDDGKGQGQGNNSNFTTINLIDSREIINKDLNDFDIQKKNNTVINKTFFTQENYNKSVPIADYTEGLSNQEIQAFDDFIEEKQTEIKNLIDLTIEPYQGDFDLPIVLNNAIPSTPTIDDIIKANIAKENLILTEDVTSTNFKFNPTNLLNQSTTDNVIILMRGLKNNI